MGHIQDLWYTTDASGERVKTRRHGKGKRYRVRYRNPAGDEVSKCFPDRHKTQAQDFLRRIEGEKLTGDYHDPRAGQISLKVYAASWLVAQTFEESTREVIGIRLRRYITPHLGSKSLAALTPETIQCWVKTLDDHGLAPNYRAVIFAHLKTILNAAVANGRIRRNPCSAQSVSKPRPRPRKLTPWSADRVAAVHHALPDRYRITALLGAGCGLRQGEVLGLAATDVNHDAGTLTVARQVKIVRGVLCFGPPKGGRTRTVPVPPNVLSALTTYQNRYPPNPVTLPWREPTGPQVTTKLILTRAQHRAVHRSTFNSNIWHRALTRAHVQPANRTNGFHALRHFYASALLDAGEPIQAVAEYLGHSDPGFTLRTYAHLMPASHERTCNALDSVLPADINGTGTAC